MKRMQIFLAVVFCSLVFQIHAAYGCRYNVREVGFIDAGNDPYLLFGYVPEGTSSEVTARLQSTIDVALLDTCIRFQVIPIGADANHPALDYLAVHEIPNGPAAILVSPDRQSRVVWRGQSIDSFEESLVPTLEDLLHSPIRQEILATAATRYGAVLLIEGPDSEANDAARTVIATARDDIAAQLEFLPKPIAHPPERVTLDRASLADEKVLLWTLGLEVEDVNQPHVAVFYGRGRWIGPLFKGDMLDADHLTQLLYVIGADCECGLDHRWLQGTMLPTRWGQELQAKVAEDLGFDPESPMIKMEMLSIVRRGTGGSAYPGVPFGYREVAVGGAETDPCASPVADVPEVAAPSAQTLSPAPLRAQVDSEEVDLEEDDSQLGIWIASVGGMILLVAIASGVILLRARKP